MHKDKLSVDRKRGYNGPLLIASIYVMSILALVPIIRYLMVFRLDLFPGWNDRFVIERVFISAPVLLATGLILLSKFKKSIHRLLGLIFCFIGGLWLIAVLVTIYQESA